MRFRHYHSGMKTPPDRWLVAAWPGMGQVATTAAVYLLSKLRMHQMAEFQGRGLFELESVDVLGGLVRAARLPRSRFFLWRNPSRGRDIIVFLGEAQPATGKMALCERLLSEGRFWGVSRFFTFSAITTDMKPSAPSRAFGIASDVVCLEELKRREVSILSEGTIGGLNGIALAAAAEAGIPAVGLLGEMPAIASQLPYPNASAAVLRTFRDLAGLDLDLAELEDYGRSMQDQLSDLYDQLVRALEQAASPGEEQSAAPAQPSAEPALEPSREKMLGDEDAERVEALFQRALNDRSTAFELKSELERLGVFRRYEDRFLDLFERGG